MSAQPCGARRPKDHSLEHIYRPIQEPITGTGRNNSGILVVRRVYDNAKYVEKRFTAEDVRNGRAVFEIFILEVLRHQNIIEYVDAFVDCRSRIPRASIFTGYANLGNLENFYRARRAADKPPFNEEAMWLLFAQMVDAVAYLQYGIRKATSTQYHECETKPGWMGIVHRDMWDLSLSKDRVSCWKLRLTLPDSKPANVFLRSQSDAPFPTVLLGDFGQAIRDDNRNWRRERMVGDPAWSPPEYPTYLYESDVWSIGVTMQATCAMKSFTSYHTGTRK